MNLLDLSIYVFQGLVWLKVIVTFFLSCCMVALASLSLHSETQQQHSCNSCIVIAAGMLVSGILSLTYIVKTALRDPQYMWTEIPRIFILAWAIYATIAISSSKCDCADRDVAIVTIAFAYIVGLLSTFIVRFPCGDGEIRT